MEEAADQLALAITAADSQTSEQALHAHDPWEVEEWSIAVIILIITDIQIDMYIMNAFDLILSIWGSGGQSHD